MIDFRVVEFKTKELCEEAVKKMNRHEIDSRKIIVKLVSVLINLKYVLGQ